MQSKKKGFTLTELLVVIVILAIIGAVASISVIKIIKDAKEKSYRVTINEIEKNANGYLNENINRLFFVPKLDQNGDVDSDTEYQCITVQNLIDYGYLKDSITEAKVAENTYVGKDNYIYVERKITTKAINMTRYIFDNTEVKELCSKSYYRDKAIMFISYPDNNTWSTKKKVTIYYKVKNIENVYDTKYTYSFDKPSYLKELKDEGKTKVVEITKNGSLEGKITFPAEVTQDNPYISAYDVKRIDTIKPVVKGNDSYSSDKPTNIVRHSTTIPITIEDIDSSGEEEQSGINEKTAISKNIYAYIGEHKIDNVRLQKVKGSNYNLVVTNDDYSGNLKIVVEKDKIFDIAGNGNIPVTLNTNIYFKNTYTISYSNESCRRSDAAGSIPSIEIKYGEYFTPNDNTGTNKFTCGTNSFMGWYDESGQEWPIKSTRYEHTKDLTLYAIWGGPTIFLPGPTVNIKMKKLAGNSKPSEASLDTKITKIKRATTEQYSTKTGLNSNNIISTTDSLYPIYMWYENNTIYYYSEDPMIYMNSDSSYMFSGLGALTDIADLEYLKTAKVINMHGLFQDAYSLSNINALAKWNTSSVTDMRAVFNILDDTIKSTQEYGKLKDISALANWNVSSVTTLEEFLQDHPDIENYNALADWDTSSVTTLHSAFGISERAYTKANARSKLTSIDGLQNWNVSKVTDFQNIFRHTEKLTNVDALINWDTSSATSFKTAFSYMDNLLNVDGLINWNTSNVTNMNGIFTSSYNLTDISGLQNWKVSKVTDFQYAFNINNATVENLHAYGHISSLAPLINWDTSSVLTMDAMFEDQVSVTDLDGLQNWDVTNVTDIGGFIGPGDSSSSYPEGVKCNITNTRNIQNDWKLNPDLKDKLKNRLNDCNAGV